MGTMNIICCCSNDTILKRWKESLSDHYTTYQATTLGDLKILLEQIKHEVILIHHTMMDVKIISQLREALPAARLFMFSDRPSDDEGLVYLRLGVVGYANSYINSVRLLEAISAVRSGSVWINQSLMQKLIAGVQEGKTEPENDNHSAPSPALQKLSNREYQIAALVADGLTNVEIAAQLEITERTVKAHLSSVYAKTNSRGRLNLALLFNTK